MKSQVSRKSAQDLASEYLMSRPVRRPKEKLVQMFDCHFVRQSFDDNYAITAQGLLTKEWVFKNTGQSVIPAECCLYPTQDHMDVEFLCHEIKQDVKVNGHFCAMI
jgi:hypothetical protein